MGLNFCVLASGSSGNCSIIWTDKAAVLIDCGRSAKYISEKLSEIDINPQNLTAAVITHAHIDHMNASGFNFLCKYNVPVYFHENILEDAYIRYGDKISNAVSFNDGFNIEDIEVNFFDTYHKDGKISKTLGFTFLSAINGRSYKVGYITDTGKICKNIVSNLSDSNILVIESNYDKKMLAESSRPYENKKWVLSDWGHLANEDAAKAIAEIRTVSTAEDSLKYVFLAHISKHHNNSEIALRVAEDTLRGMNISDINLFAAKRNSRCRAVKIS